MRRNNSLVARWLLGSVGVLTAALLFTMALPVLLPPGPAEIDNIVWPLVLAPVFWALLFTYICLEENLRRSAILLGGISVVCGTIVGFTLFA